MTLIPLDEEQMHAAARAYQTYGCVNHPAGLNFGDTFPYALATTGDRPCFTRATISPRPT